MGELVLKKRKPTAIVRYSLEQLERSAVKRGEFPVLVHAALEAMDHVDARIKELEVRIRRIRDTADLGHRPERCAESAYEGSDTQRLDLIWVLTGAAPAAKEENGD